MNKNEHENLALEYIDFQKQCPSPFHVVAALKKRLISLGFQDLSDSKSWQLAAAKGYFVVHPSRKSLISFFTGSKAPQQSGFAIIGAHTDSPALRLKLNPWGTLHGSQILYNQNHGHMILRSWLDRPLVIAGEVYRTKRSKNGGPMFSETGLPIVEHQLVASPWPVAIIPDLAIHLDREKNEKGSINPESMIAILGQENALDSKTVLQKALACEDFDAFELSYAPYAPHELVGTNKEFIVGPRHDDLVMVFVAQLALEKLAGQGAGPKTAVAAFFDSEETGSTTFGGANSTFMRDTLARIHTHYPNAQAEEPLSQSMVHSFFISADVAHGVHPAFRERHDNNHRPVLNGGIVVKENANDRYASSGYGVSLFKALCAASEVPMQLFCARQDIPCGSTIGPILSAKLGCHSLDVGIPLWSMHSAGETIGTFDLAPTVKVFEKFYSGGR